MNLHETNQKIEAAKISKSKKELLKELVWLQVNKSKIEDIVFNREDEVPSDVIAILKANINQVRIDELYSKLNLSDLEILH